MPINSTGLIKFSNLMANFNVSDNLDAFSKSIKFSNFYVDSTSNLTFNYRIPELAIIPKKNTPISLNKYKGVNNNLLSISIYSTESITTTIPYINRVIDSTTDYYIKLLHQGSTNTSTVYNYTDYSIIFPFNVTAEILLVGGGGGGGCGGFDGGSGGGSGEILNIQSFSFIKDKSYKIRIGAGGLGRQSITDYTTINGTSSILFDESNNQLLYAMGGKRGYNKPEATIFPPIPTIYKYTTIFWNTWNTSLFLVTNAYISYNYSDFISISAGTYNIVFNKGSITVGNLAPNYSYPRLASNHTPILWYKFETNSTYLNEATKNPLYNLTNYSTTFNNTTYVKGNGTVKFTPNQYLELPNNIDLNSINISTGISFSLWVYLDPATEGLSRIFDFGTCNSSNGSRFIIIYKSFNVNEIIFQISTAVTDGNTAETNYRVSMSYIPSTWYHIVWSISSFGFWYIFANNISIYIGQQVVIPPFTISSKHYYLGKSLYTSDPYLNGYIDDFRIYANVLYLPDVAELYNGRIETKYSLFSYINDINIRQIETPYINNNSKLYGYGTSLSYTRFSYTGLISRFTIPEDVHYITIYCWGAGGGGSYSFMRGVAGGYGGNGGFVKTTLDVRSIRFLDIIVGQGGRKGIYASSTASAFGGGGSTAGATNDGHWGFGGGGGLSGVFIPNNNMSVTDNVINQYATSIVIAGGGGGAGAYAGIHGGNAGGETGNACYNSGGGAGGTQMTGGHNAGYKYTGGNCSNYGGGGGGGYYGGGSSTVGGGDYAAGGGGGSSYVNTTDFIQSNIYMPNPYSNGTRTALGKTYNYYETNIGLGSDIGLYDGYNGLVVIEYFYADNILYSPGGWCGRGSEDGKNGAYAKVFSITGNTEYYAAEGGGSSYGGTQGLGGISEPNTYIGGNGTNNSSTIKISHAVANTGSGGGGSSCDGTNPSIGGNGSAGICIIRFTPNMYIPPLSDTTLTFDNVNWVPNVNNQLIITINSLKYIIGFSSAYLQWGGDYPHILLDRNPTTIWRVGINNVFFYGMYSGDNYLVNDCVAEYVWYKLPYKLMLKGYRVICSGEGIPSFWKIYGSNDGINWEHIPQASMISSSPMFGNYVFGKDLDTYSNPYSYFSLNILAVSSVAGDGTCVISGFELYGSVYNLTNILYTLPYKVGRNKLWQFINNTEINNTECILQEQLNKNTYTIESILQTVLANSGYIGVYIYDISETYWLVRYISEATSITYIYDRYGNYTNNFPNKRYAYIHMIRANNNQVLVDNTNISSLTYSAIHIKTASIYAHYTGDGPFILNGTAITQWNDISGYNRHITKYRGSPYKSTFTGGTCGINDNKSFKTVSGTFNDGFKLPNTLPINHTFVYVARYIGDISTTYNKRIFDSDISIPNYIWGFDNNYTCRTYRRNIGWVSTITQKMSEFNYWLIGIETNVSSRFNGIDFTNNYCNYGNNYSFPPRLLHSPSVAINYGYNIESYHNDAASSNWEIAEIIIYDSELTENEQITLENYLAVKYQHISFKSVIPTISDYKFLNQTGKYHLWYNIWDGGQYGFANLKWYGPGWGTFFNIDLNYYWGYCWTNTEIVTTVGYTNRNMQNKLIKWTSPNGATNLCIVAGGGGGGGGGNYGGGGGGGGLIILNNYNYNNLSKTNFYFNIGGIGRGGYYINSDLYNTSGGDTTIKYNNNIFTAYGGSQAAHGSRSYGLGGNYDSCVILQYPPIVYNKTSGETTTTFLNKTVYTETITITANLSYGSGSYVIYSSSTFVYYTKSMLFDYNMSNVGCHFALSQYPNGIYNGSNCIKEDYFGDWIIIKFPIPIKLYYYNIIARPGTVGRAPAEWKLYGSNDGIVFDEIPEGHQLTRLTTSDYNKYNCYTKIINNTTTTFYLYYGICINKSMTTSDAILNFTQIQFFGDEISRTSIINPTLQKYPPKIYNSVSTEILVEFLDNNRYATVITLNTTDITYGSGKYIIYTSATTNDNTKQLLLNTTKSEIGVSWNTAQYNSSGIYIGGNYIRRDYMGDWVVIQLPVQIQLANYSIYSRSGYENNAPGEWKLYGSNNGYIFFEIPTGSQTSRITTTNYTSNSGKYTITVNSTILYLYYGIVINKLAGNSTILNFTEIEFYGYEAIIQGGSGGIGTVVDNNNYLGGALYQPTNTLANSVSLWTILNTSTIFNIVSLNSTSISGNSSGNGGLGSRDSIALDTNNRHGQNGGWGFTGIIFDYNYSDVIIFTEIDFKGNNMVLNIGKYYFSNNITSFNNVINSIKVSYGYKVLLYENDTLLGYSNPIKDNISDLSIYNLSNNISSIQVKQLVSIYKSNNYTGDFLYLDVGNISITTLDWDNSINSIKIPNGHYYKVSCYDTLDYTGTPIILTVDTPNLTDLSFGNRIGSIIIEELAGIGLYDLPNYIGGYLYIDNPRNDAIYNFPNDYYSSIYIPPNHGYHITLYADGGYLGNIITLTNSVPDLATLSFTNMLSSYVAQLLTGVRIFKNINLYGEQYYLIPGKYGLTSIDWANSINSISIPNGYTVKCYTTSIFSIERQYPPKLYNTIDTVPTLFTYNGFTAYKMNFTLNSTNITHGIGDYILTFSNRFILTGREYGALPSRLFDFTINTDNTNAADFLNTDIVGFNTDGNYIGERYLATTTYKGEWFFLKLPTKIILTKYIIYGNATYVGRNPALWKIYGSSDGVTWEEIVQASVSTKLTSADYSSNSFIYTKTLSIPSQEYNYIGCCISSIISEAELSFIEFQIFGQEYNNLIPANITLTTNVQDLSSLNYSNNINSIIITTV